MPDNGTQKPLPFPRSKSLKPAPDDGFPLTRERAAMRQKVASLQRILDYQGGSAVALTIKDEQIRALETYIKALEKEVRRLAEW